MTVWLILGAAFDEGGWVVHGVFSSRRNALRFAATFAHQTYLSERLLDGVIAEGSADAVTRCDFLAEGLDFDLVTA